MDSMAYRLWGLCLTSVVLLEVTSVPVVTNVTNVPVVTNVTSVLGVTNVTSVPVVTNVTSVPVVTNITSVLGVTNVTSVPVVTNVTSEPVVTNTRSDQFHKPTTIHMQMNDSHLSDVISEDHKPKEPIKVTLPPTGDDVTSASVDPAISAMTSNIQILQQQLKMCEEQLRLKIGDKHPGLHRGPAVNDTVDEGNDNEDYDKDEEDEKENDDVDDTTTTPERNDSAAEDEPDDDTSRVTPEVEHDQKPVAVTKAADDFTSTQVKTGSTTAAAQVSEINRLSAILAGLNHSLTECYKIHTNWNNSHLV